MSFLMICRFRSCDPLLPLFVLLAASVWAEAQPQQAADDTKRWWSASVEAQLAIAGTHREPLEAALHGVEPEQRPSMAFLIEHMPPGDLKKLSSELLLDNVRLAHQARTNSPWKLSDELFREQVLPYANVDETRENWRRSLYPIARRLTAACQTPAEAAQRLNEKLFAELKVVYSTKRKKANQSPSESIKQGLASCTGLSILLVDACRSVNVPARLAGIPSWPHKQGNHTWVEVWDGERWRFTGAAEFSAEGLDRTWFNNDAAQADPLNKLHSIYAVSFRRTDTLFPLVWSDEARVHAINVTNRYLTQGNRVPAGKVRVSVSVVAADQRIAIPLVIREAESGEQIATGTSRDESADTNDFATFDLPQGKAYVLECDERHNEPFSTKATDTRLRIDVELPPRAGPAASPATGDDPLTEEAASAAAEKQRQDRIARLRADRKAEWEAKSIQLGDLNMKFDFKTFGKAPESGRSLYISLHGGGETTAAANDQQWQNQIGLYQPAEGIYLAPRAPTDSWNMWHKAHIDRFFARLIEDAIVFAGVDPNRVYLMGYSAGGDGVYQLAPRMADQLAAAAMSAGHPNNASPLGLRNIGFTIHMGAEDARFQRNEVAAKWKERLAALQAGDPTGYPHEVHIHAGLSHWMNLNDAVAVPWMAKFRRDPWPARIVWQQAAVTHDRCYWLAAAPGTAKQGTILEVSREGNRFTVHRADGLTRFIIRLNDQMADLDQPIIVAFKNSTKNYAQIVRSERVIRESLRDRCDRGSIFTAEVAVDLATFAKPQER
jgi:poly(3-hydroxybutyrate) depolymerase